MRIWVLGIGLLAATSFGLERPSAVVRMKRGTAGRRITFGLTAKQADQLYRASGKKADLRALYVVPERDLEALDWKDASMEGWMDSEPVPPPGFTGVADPGLDGEWWHKKLELADAWKKATGKGVTIADCDSGFYTGEPDLASNLLLDERYDLADKNEPRRIDDGGFVSHGTSVAAIMVGALDGKGTNGIAFDSKLVPLQNFNYSPADSIPKEEATARCILRAITVQAVKIIVLENQTSQGSSETFAGTRAAARLALAAGVTIVSAGGNYQKELTIEQGDDTGTIIVGAVEPTGEQSSFSNFGPRISVAAFGRNLQTLSGPNGAMGSFGGTSGATPQVAATVALMLEVNPKLTPAQVRQVLEKTRLTKADNKNVGGMLNVRGALDEAAKLRTSRTQPGYAQATNLRKQVVKILSGK